MFKYALLVICLAVAASASLAHVCREEDCEIVDDIAMLALRTSKAGTMLTTNGCNSSKTALLGPSGGPLPVAYPTTKAELLEQGWHMHGSSCDPSLGYGWTKEGEGVTKTNPHIIYTTKGGQFQGIGVAYAGGITASQQKWATTSPLVPTGSLTSSQIVDIAFRSGDIVCSGESSSCVMGDEDLIVNPTGTSKLIPLTPEEGEQRHWIRGACFDNMGWHWSYFEDSEPPSPSNAFPVVPMFSEGSINGVFFLSETVQQIFDGANVTTNGWDTVMVNNCVNLCDPTCNNGTSWNISPMHWFFKSVEEMLEVKCPDKLYYYNLPGIGGCMEEMPFHTEYVQ